MRKSSYYQTCVFATETMQKASDIVTLSEILGYAKPSMPMDMYGYTIDERKRALMARMYRIIHQFIRYGNIQ